MSRQAYELSISSPITRWDEALPLGNGLCGALLYGEDCLRLSLDRSDLWDLRPAPQTLDDGYRYEELIQLATKKKQADITRRFASFYNTEPNPTKIPAGALEFHFSGVPMDLNYHLDLRTALAKVTFTVNGAPVCCKAFLSRKTNLGYLLFEGAPGETLTLLPPDYQRKKEEEQYSLSRLGYPKAAMSREEPLSYFVQQTAEQTPYAIVAGKQSTEEGALYVFAIASHVDGEGWLESAKQAVSNALQEGWSAALEPHLTWWEKHHAQSSLHLPRGDFALEHHWFLNNYLFASTSREGCPPLALQGVWTADDGKIPPWKGDYHYDLNVQLSYSHYLCANRLDAGTCIVDYLLSLAPNARRFAKEFYGCEGLILPSVADLRGRPMGGWAQYSYSPTNHCWTCQMLADYIDYTGDLDLLREKVYPFLKESAQVLLHLLKEDANGGLKLPLSTSPEYHSNSVKAWLRPNTNYDTALMRAHFETLARFAELLRNGESALWQAKAEKLPPLAQDRRGALKITANQGYNESHRHQSHAMAIYPLQQIRYDTPEHKRTIDATLRRMEKKGERRWNGYTYPWSACLYNMAGDGARARGMLCAFTERFLSQNGFHLNTDFRKAGTNNRPFTLEGNFAFNDALQQMLLQNRDGCVALFPALPQAWQNEGVSFDRLRAKGGYVLSAAMKNHRLTALTVWAKEESTITLEFEANRFTLSLCAGENTVALPLE